MPRTLVIGLGNPILGDDGVGWRVVETLRRMPAALAPTIDVDCHAGGGLGLMERFVGYDQVVVIDAVTLGRGPVGSVTCLPLEALPDLCGGHLVSSHETSLKTALAVGRMLGAALPSQVTVIGIETRPAFDFSEQLSPAVARAVAVAAECAVRQLSEHPAKDAVAGFCTGR